MAELRQKFSGQIRHAVLDSGFSYEALGIKLRVPATEVSKFVRGGIATVKLIDAIAGLLELHVVVGKRSPAAAPK